MLRKAILPGSILVSIILVGCATSPETQMVYALPSETQTGAYKSCSEELNIPAHLQIMEFDEARRHIYAVNSNGVSLMQARSLNKCAYDKMVAIAQTQ